MRSVADLDLGFRDAENYRRRENKQLLNDLFVRTPALDALCGNGKYFLVGEKGTGKTAYVVYLSNNNYRDNMASLRYIRETEYHKFLELKRSQNLVLSDYTNIWRIILYLLISEDVIHRAAEESLLPSFVKFRTLKAAIDEYYLNAFSPEIIHAINFVEESKRAAELIFKHAKLGGEETEKVNFSESRFQTNLLYIQKHFEAALRTLKLKRNHILFIDGIDVRPSSTPYPDYLECVKGLANAVWSINNDFFASIKDSNGRLRVVLLTRPDIFNSLSLQNTNSKVRDQCSCTGLADNLSGPQALRTLPSYRSSTCISATSSTRQRQSMGSLFPI